MHSLRAFNDRRAEKRALKAANDDTASEKYTLKTDSPTYFNVGHTKGVMAQIQEGSEAGANMSRKERYAAAIKTTDDKFGKADTGTEWRAESKRGN
jgi:hypothetical protein